MITQYNGLVRLRNETQNAWAQVDVVLRRRYDLVPNLVETVKGYAAHERETLEAVIQARSGAIDASAVTDQADSENISSDDLVDMLLRDVPVELAERAASRVP